MAKPRMKVIKVELLIEVDAERVDAEYGYHHSPAALRDWLKGEAQAATESALDQVGATVSVKNR